jgi:uncharacterized Zn-binding protein involved in type VI secretion
MPKISRKGDKDSGGGAITRGASTVFANGVAVGLHVSDITNHGHGPHGSAKTTSASPTVFAEGVAVLRVGSGNSCGHPIIDGSPDVFVP